MKQISQDLKFSAVYSIMNLKTGMRYIGSTRNLYGRMLKHRSLLRHDCHPNWKLQSDWNVLGEDMFDYEIIEKCAKEDLLEREDFYIHNITCSYNIASGTIDYSYPEESREKMSKGRKLGFKNGTIKCYQKKCVYKYDLDGNLVAEYNCIKEAAIAEKIDRSSINRCLSGTYSQMNGFRWSLEKKDNIGKYVKPPHILPNKYIYIVSDETSTLKFDGCKACAQYFGVSCNSIEQVIRNGNLYHKKYRITKVCRSHE